MDNPQVFFRRNNPKSAFLTGSREAKSTFRSCNRKGIPFHLVTFESRSRNEIGPAGPDPERHAPSRKGSVEQPIVALASRSAYLKK